MAEPNRAIIYTKPPIALHNYLRANESSTYCPPGITDVEDAARNTVNGSWRSDEDLCCGLEPLRKSGSNMYASYIAISFLSI